MEDINLNVEYEIEKIDNIQNLSFPIRILDNGVIYRCDNPSQFYEWLEDEEGAQQARVTEFKKVTRVEEISDSIGSAINGREVSYINEIEFDVAIDAMANMIGRKSNEFLKEKDPQ
jgi:hypothetical protein